MDIFFREDDDDSVKNVTLEAEGVRKVQDKLEKGVDKDTNDGYIKPGCYGRH